MNDVTELLFEAAAEEPGSGDEVEGGDEGHLPGVAEDDIKGHRFEEAAFRDHEEVAQRVEVGKPL